MSELAGKKFDGEKVDMDLLSPHALEKIAQVMTYGKTKYGRDNWRGGLVFSRLIAAVMRHINAYRKGETFDPETGLSHLSHASCGLMMLLEFEETRPDLDDRFFKEKIDEVTEMIEKELDLTPKIKFTKGDIVKHVNNDAELTVEATFFDAYGDPVLFIKDADGKIFGVEPEYYKTIYKEDTRASS